MMTTIKRMTLTNVCIAVMLLAIGGTVAAQDNGDPQQTRPGVSTAARAQRPDRAVPADSTFRFVRSEMRFGGPPVKGAPYSATAITEDTQTLRDGTSITRKDTTAVYRDGEGRTRIEQTLSRIGPFSSSDHARQMTSIQDPVAGVHYVLDAQGKTAQKMRARGGRGPRPQSFRFSSSAKTESLGMQAIEGVQAEGTRTTLTIAAGQIGNDRPIDVVDERWYSPDLQVVVLSKHSDPRMGEHVYRLTSINRSEPARTLFEVPSDYTVTEGPVNRGRGPRGPKPFIK